MMRALGLTATLLVVLGAGSNEGDQNEIRVQQVCRTELIEDLRIGSVAGPEEYSFGQIQDLATRRDGSIFVVDLHPQSIRQFDHAGEFVRQIGREGEGPGEYRSLLGTAI